MTNRPSVGSSVSVAVSLFFVFPNLAEDSVSQFAFVFICLIVCFILASTKQADVVPVFGAMFAERALPPRMRAFAVQVREYHQTSANQ